MVRWMVRRDISRVLEIAQAVGNKEVTEKDIINQLREPDIVGMVIAEGDDEVIGYMIYELHKVRLHLLAIVADPKKNINYILQSLINKLKSKLSSHRRKLITIIVRETELALQLVLKAEGFFAFKVLKEHYVDTNEDGYIFTFELAKVEKSDVSCLGV
jgi:[ribosomal protein S18]-alanine N-acetyltransferase